MKTMLTILLLAVIVVVFLLWMCGSAEANPSIHGLWWLNITYTVKDSASNCAGEIFQESDNLLSRAGWIRAKHNFGPWVNQPGTLRRLVSGKTITSKIPVTNWRYTIVAHNQSLLQRPGGSLYWVPNAVCDTMRCNIWMGWANCWTQGGEIFLFQRLEPVYGSGDGQ